MLHTDSWYFERRNLMELTERISFFMELIRCEHSLNLWTYAPDFQMVETDSLVYAMHTDIVALLHFASLMQSHLRSGNHNPIVLDTELGLTWVAAFDYTDTVLRQIYLIGPVFTGSNSHLRLRNKLDSYQLSVKLKMHVWKQLEYVPIVPSSTLLSYAIMFHRALTGTYISADQVSFSSIRNTDFSQDVSPSPADDHPGIWMSEQSFLGMIREGNPDYIKALGKSMTLSSGMKADMGEPLRAGKNNILVLLTLCSRASIEGGLNPSVAYNLNDYYAGRIESCRTNADISNLSREFLDDYVTRVRETKEADESSRQIRNVCDYISLHVREPIRISDLALRLGYSEYYFSRKFKEIMGCTIHTYIRQKKIEEAKLLLSGTTLGMQEISDELSFGSRSYFASCFQKETGMPPSKYRQMHCNL